MVRAIPLLFILMFALLCAGGTSQVHSNSGVPAYSNPVFSKPFPDPMVLRVGAHDYYAYGTSLGWTVGYFPILHSTDLIHWKYVGDAFKQFPSWGKGDFWAPDVVKHGKTYIMFYTGRNEQTHCIAVATASSPQGPFKTRAIVGCSFDGHLGFIDPDPFIDSDGKPYLYVSVDSPDHVIVGAPLSRDLLHVEGSFKVLFGVSQPWEQSTVFTTVEGPFMVKHHGIYYMFYSGNSFQANYAMGYATSTSPLGPFTKYAKNPILRGDSRVKGPGGGSVVTGPDGGQWMVYHAWSGPEGAGNQDTRTMRIDPLVWKGNAASVTVHP